MKNYQRLASLLLLLSLSLPAAALNLNEAMSALGDVKASGQLGEMPNGYLGVVSAGGQAAEIAKQNAQTNGILSGRLAATGEGVVIRISQGSKQKIDSAILFTLLEELRNSGAEVIEINNVRVVTSTYISGTAGSLVCDGTKLKSPFTIRAIGDSDIYGAQQHAPLLDIAFETDDGGS